MKLDDIIRMQTGASPRKKSRHLEDRLQISCVRWWDMTHPNDKRLLSHSANGGKRNIIEAAKFKEMGVRAGFPDLILLIPNKFYPFMGIELKTATGRQSEQQKAYQREFERRGYKYVIVRSLNEFIKVVSDYLQDV